MSRRSARRGTSVCAPRWAYGNVSIGSKIPRNSTLVYDVELLRWRAGPPIENTDFDMETYRAAMEGKEAGSGAVRSKGYAWSEHGEDVTIYVPLQDGEGAKDVRCEIHPKRIEIAVGTRSSSGGNQRTESGVSNARATNQ